LPDFFVLLFYKFGLNVGSGPYNDKGILDDDTIQISTYHYYDVAASTVNINATAKMATNTTILSTTVTLDGSQVRKFC
jgi:archaellum component FlaF (FlaF/FlaG flagellin family)